MELQEVRPAQTRQRGEEVGSWAQDQQERGQARHERLMPVDWRMMQ
jgi:hypothetical protein